MSLINNKIDLQECIKCGKCNEVCQSYKIFMNESFSPRGRLRLIDAFYERELTQGKSFNERILSCMLCGFCENICPLGINLPFLIYKTRAEIKKNKLFYLFKYFSLYPDIFFRSLKILRKTGLIDKFGKFFLKNQFLDKYLAFNINARDEKFLKIYSVVKPIGRVAIFLGCSTNFLIPSIGKNLIFLLNKAKYEVIIPKQICCGAPLLSSGFNEEAIKIASENIDMYKGFKIEGIVTPCPTCAHILKDVYKDLVGESLPVVSPLDLLEDMGEFSVVNEKLVYFHSSCHTQNYTRDDEKILNLLKNLGFINIQKKSGCCGFAGLFSFLFEKQSMDILRKKVLEYDKADMIITSCPNCIIQLKYAMKSKKILHYIEAIQDKTLMKGERYGR